MQCANCQADNPEEHRFCEQCGSPLELRCPQCQASARPNARFCGACGYRLAESATTAATPTTAPQSPSATPPVATDYHSRLAAYTPKHLADKVLTSRSALEGERRVVTALFTDTAGFTALAEKLDPEDVHQIMDRCFELITEAVHRFEGTINQYTGDGVMALFGAPIAHEDGPRRAVHAALAIQQGLRDLSQEVQTQHGFPLQTRIGLNTGTVVVGKIGDDLRMDYTAVGDTTNVAARMQQLARPGSVVTSEATHKLIEGFFETQDLGEQQVKGHTPVRVFEVLRARSRRARLDVAVERGLTPLIDRERELAICRDLFQQVTTGHGQVVLVAGEAGIGKSRLLLELRRALDLAGEHVTWLEGRCISFGQSIPLLPVIDQLREVFGIEGIDGEPEIIAKVEHGIRRLGGKWGEEYMKWRYMQHCCHSLGELWLRKGEAEKALQFAEECLQLAEPTESRKNMVKGWRLWGQALQAQGKLQEAEAMLGKALPPAKEVGNPPQLWKTYQALGELHEKQGKPDQARSAYGSALEVIERVAHQLQYQEIKKTFLTAKPVQELRNKVIGRQ